MVSLSGSTLSPYPARPSIQQPPTGPHTLIRRFPVPEQPRAHIYTWGTLARALVLNASYQPLCVVPVRRALVLALKEKADVIHTNGQVFRSESLEIRAPSVVKLRYFVKVPYRSRTSLSRRAVFVRDDYQCQYCGRPAENVDHVIPRSKGGSHTWDNVVAACKPCNSRKENRSPSEAGLNLRRPPHRPRHSVWITVAVDSVDPQWEPYLRLA
jgi:5-methylcytosine-specific restriction endonuclease McrA